MKTIVERSGGNVSVESDFLKKGSVFAFNMKMAAIDLYKRLSVPKTRLDSDLLENLVGNNSDCGSPDKKSQLNIPVNTSNEILEDELSQEDIVLS